MDGIDLRFYWGLIRRRSLLLAGSFVTVFGIAFAIAILLPPLYRSQAKIVIESQQIPEELVRSTITGLAEERLQVIRQKITARDRLLDIVQKFNLFPHQRANRSSTELVDLMRQRVSIELFNLATAVGARGSGLAIAFTVGFDYENPDVASQVANELVTLILNENVRTRTQQASGTARFLERETERRRGEIVALEAQLAAFRSKNQELLPENIQFQMKRLSEASETRSALDREFQQLDEQERLLRFEIDVRSGSVDGGATTAASDPLGRALEQLQGELAQKRTVYSESHPDIRSLRKQIDALTAERKAQFNTITSASNDIAVGSDLDSKLAAEKLGALNSRREFVRRQMKIQDENISALNLLIARAPEVQTGLNDLQRRRDVLQTDLDDLSKKLGEARLGEKLEQDQQAESFQVVEQPITPEEPFKPNRPLLIFGGLALAAAVSAGSVIGLEVFDRSIRGSSDLAKYLDMRPLVSIPYLRSSHEIRRKRIRAIAGVALFLCMLAVALTWIHFNYMPLDIAASKVAQRLGIRW